MTELKPGTPCYLVRLGEMCEFNGHIVVTESGPRQEADFSGDAYTVRAGWAAELFPGREMIAARRNLKPLLPPEHDARMKRGYASVSTEPRERSLRAPGKEFSHD